jgi:hypothetical protein
MNLEIRIKSIEDDSKGKYNQLTIEYVDLGSGKEHSYKLMSFVNKDAYLLLKSAKSGDVFYVVCNKNDKGYWQWDQVSREAMQPKANPSPRSTYETPEERAQKQIYIVRQSSLTNAIALLGTKAKVDAVISVARQFEQYVFGLDERESLDDLPIIDEDQ